MKINKIYTKKETIEQMQRFFENEGFIQLNEFLDNNQIEELKKQLEKINPKEDYKPLEHKKSTYQTKEIFIPEIIEFIEFFKGKEFLNFIESVTQLNLRVKNLELNQYKHKDFIILNDKQTTNEDFINVILDLSDKFSEEMGGLLTYTTKEEEILYLEPANNTLNIIFKPCEINKYLKYINNKAQNKKILRLEIQLELVEIEE